MWPKLGVSDRAQRVSLSVWRESHKKMAVAMVPGWLPPQAQLLCVNLQFTLVELWFVFVLELGSDRCQRFMHMLACFCIQAEMSRYTWHVVGYAILLKPIGFVSGWPEKVLTPSA